VAVPDMDKTINWVSCMRVMADDHCYCCTLRPTVAKNGWHMIARYIKFNRSSLLAMDQDKITQNMLRTEKMP